MIDPIADMITRIRNASAVKKFEVILPMSKIKFEVAKILEREGWVQKAEAMKKIDGSEDCVFDQLKIVLKYKKSGRPAIT